MFKLANYLPAVSLSAQNCRDPHAVTNTPGQEKKQWQQ